MFNGKRAAVDPWLAAKALRDLPARALLMILRTFTFFVGDAMS